MKKSKIMRKKEKRHKQPERCNTQIIGNQSIKNRADREKKNK